VQAAIKKWLEKLGMSGEPVEISVIESQPLLIVPVNNLRQSRWLEIAGTAQSG